VALVSGRLRKLYALYFMFSPIGHGFMCCLFDVDLYVDVDVDDDDDDDDATQHMCVIG